mgnify:CR=1 FL=1
MCHSRTWINDDSLTRIDELAGNHAQVIIAAPPSIKRDSIEALTEWGGAEARLFFWRDLPEQQPGFLNHEQNDRWIAEQTAELAKGRQFDSAEELVSQLWSRLALNGADEIMYQDVVASLYQRNSLTDIIERTSKDIFIPLTVVGGIRTIDDIRRILRSGCSEVRPSTRRSSRSVCLRVPREAVGRRSGPRHRAF